MVRNWVVEEVVNFGSRHDGCYMFAATGGALYCRCPEMLLVAMGSGVRGALMTPEGRLCQHVTCLHTQLQNQRRQPSMAGHRSLFFALRTTAGTVPSVALYISAQ